MTITNVKLCKGYVYELIMSECEDAIENITKQGVSNSKNMEFKKPVLIGKVGRLPRKVDDQKIVEKVVEESQELKKDELEHTDDVLPEQNATSSMDKSKIQPLPYKEPSWSGLPQSNSRKYEVEVLKGGKIIENINLMEKSFWVFGRLENCDIPMAHPTVSRYHAVLQYRSTASDEKLPGFYLYDLNSTHGTFLNKNRIRPQVYVRVQVGHMISIGCSTRHYILNGPEYDEEEESELSVTELKQLRNDKILQKQKDLEEAEFKAKEEEEAQKRKQEQNGIDWGMGEDAEEESDLSENPYAQTNNEELYIEDPKKALRGFMEREGHDLEYDCTEQGMGQFLCKVVLPLDDERGRPIIAEILHKGKKKEAVIQCALEACRILDRHGVLRQATHESRKRKAKNWEENDFYDSDEDTYLDRTGTIEKKRENRMKSKIPQQAETYDSLIEKEKKISEEISKIEKQLSNSSKANSGASSSKDEDSLDSYMKSLSYSTLDKQKISMLKSELAKLKNEHSQVVKLVNIAKPADLPPLVITYDFDSKKNNLQDTKGLPLFGKRKKIKVQLPEKPKEHLQQMDVDEEEVEEDDPCDDNTNPSVAVENNGETNEPSSSNVENTNVRTVDDMLSLDVGELTRILNFDLQSLSVNIEKFKSIFGSSILKFQELDKIVDKIKAIVVEEDKMQMYSKTLVVKTKKLMKQMMDLTESEDPKLEYKVSAESDRILNEINEIIEHKNEVLKNMKEINKEYKEMVAKVLKELIEIQKLYKKRSSKKLKTQEDNMTDKVESEDNSNKDNEAEGETQVDSEKRRRKNQRRIHQRSEKAELEKQKGYKEDAGKEDYNMWVPPEGQSGDGRTTLNDKLGY